MKSKHRKTATKKTSGVPPKKPSPQPGLMEFFANSPLAKFGIALKRKRDYGRKIQL